MRLAIFLLILSVGTHSMAIMQVHCPTSWSKNLPAHSLPMVLSIPTHTHEPALIVGNNMGEGKGCMVQFETRIFATFLEGRSFLRLILFPAFTQNWKGCGMPAIIYVESSLDQYVIGNAKKVYMGNTASKVKLLP